MSVTVTSNVGNPYRHTINTGRHVFYADSDAPANKHRGAIQATAPSPHELLLGALGACTSMKIQAVAEVKGLKLQDVTVEVSDGGTKTAPTIEKKISITAPGLSAADVASLEKNAAKCHINTVLTSGRPTQANFNWTI